jgi:SSS family solute:Na+ symporter
MRAVAYTEAAQTIILIIGSLLLTVFGLQALGGWGELRAVLGSDMFNLWKPLVPAGMEGTWAPVKETGRIAWYFNSNYPWLGMLFCAPIIGLWYWCTDQYIVQRALGAPNQTEARRGTIFAAFLKLLPVFIFIIPGMIAIALAKSGRAPALAVMVDASGRAIPEAAQGAFPLMVQHAHELAGRGLQRLLDPLHHRLLPEVPAGGLAAAARVGRPSRDHGDGADWARMDPCDSGREGTL